MMIWRRFWDAADARFRNHHIVDIGIERIGLRHVDSPADADLCHRNHLGRQSCLARNFLHAIEPQRLQGRGVVVLPFDAHPRIGRDGHGPCAY